jgi:hypothetical protein
MDFPRVSSWGQLLERLEDGEEVRKPDSERRLDVRHLGEADASCWLVEAGGGPPVAARVQNVSRGGLSLQVSRPFEAGAVLCVTLPADSRETPSRLLACVLHVHGEPDGEWTLGCTFVAPLGAEDLHAFRVEERPPPAAEAQRDDGVVDNLQAWFRPVGGAGREFVPARVVDISALGVAFLVEEALEIGDILSLELQGHGPGAVVKTLGCVVRVGPEGNAWRLGCHFIRLLSDRELDTLCAR